MKKRKLIKDMKTELKLGNRGLKISLIFLLILFFFSFTSILSSNSLSESVVIMLKPPLSMNDGLMILAGSILFIIVPFLLGIKTGKKRK